MSDNPEQTEARLRALQTVVVELMAKLITVKALSLEDAQDVFSKVINDSHFEDEASYLEGLLMVLKDKTRR